MNDRTHTTWNPDIIRKVAEAITGVLFEEDPGEPVSQVILYGAAIALDAIGREIARGCGDGSTIDLPHPSTVLEDDEANV